MFRRAEWSRQQADRHRWWRGVNIMGCYDNYLPPRRWCSRGHLLVMSDCLQDNTKATQLIFVKIFFQGDEAFAVKEPSQSRDLLVSLSLTTCSLTSQETWNGPTSINEATLNILPTTPRHIWWCHFQLCYEVFSNTLCWVLLNTCLTLWAPRDKIPSGSIVSERRQTR